MRFVTSAVHQPAPTCRALLRCAPPRARPIARRWRGHGSPRVVSPAAACRSSRMRALRTIGYLLAFGLNGAAAQACCVAPATPIAELRARGGHIWLGRDISVQAVVTADFSTAGGLGGFFVQTPDAERAHRAGVSEGLFVRSRSNGGIKAGDLVCVQGRLEAHADHLELLRNRDAPKRCGSGKPVTPIDLTLPVDHPGRFAELEDMRIRLPQKLTISDADELGRHGSLLLSQGRLLQPTQQSDPVQARVAAERNARNRIVLDDGRGIANPDLHGSAAALPMLRAGQHIAPLDGVLEMRYGAWRLQPLPGQAITQVVSADASRPPPPTRPPHADLRVVAFNLRNYFNGDDAEHFPARDRRGARDPQAFARQETKLLAALRGLQPDVIGLMEVANNGFGPHGAIARLARQLGPYWRVVDPGTKRLGSDAIMVALLYDNRRVAPVGAPASALLDGMPRPPLVQRFRRQGGHATVMVVANHLKSRLCLRAKGAELDRDGQGCWNAARTRAAQALTQWVAGLSAPNAPDDTLLIGDLNSYAAETPLQALANAGYLDLVARLAGPGSYTYVHHGAAGYLDHALARPALAQRVKAVRVWHINADETPARSYDAIGNSKRYRPDAYRSSDHDPLVIDLALDHD